MRAARDGEHLGRGAWHPATAARVLTAACLASDQKQGNTNVALILLRNTPVSRRDRLCCVATTAQGRRQLLVQQLLDEPADAFADADFDRIKPGLSGKQPSVNRVRRRAILFLGVVFAGVPTRVVVG
jgi:hypothetical protein